MLNQFDNNKKSKVVNIDFTKNLTSIETAKILGISKSRVFQLVKSGKLTVKTIYQGVNNKRCLFDAKEIENYKERQGCKIDTIQINPSNVNLTDLTIRQQQNENEELKKKTEQLVFELGKFNGLLSGKEEQLRQTQNLLTERAESLFEKEAKIKELESKLEEEKRKTELKEKENEENLKKIESKLKKEKEDKENLKLELLFKNMSWWKKLFNSKENIEKEIRKKMEKENN